MELDWFSLIAQLVNFVVLLVLLRVFLYGPIRRVMRDREAQIHDTRTEAEALREEARAEAEELRRERAELEQARRERLAEVEREAEALAERRREEVEQEARALRSALADALRRDQAQLLDLLRRRNSDLLLEALRSALAGLADASLEQQAVVVFRRQLGRLDEAARNELREAARSAPVVLATAFEPSDEVRSELEEAVRELTGTDLSPRFEVDERLLFGVTLSVGGIRVDGSASGHLEALQEAFDTALNDLGGGSDRAAGPASTAQEPS